MATTETTSMIHVLTRTKSIHDMEVHKLSTCSATVKAGKRRGWTCGKPSLLDCDMCHVHFILHNQEGFAKRIFRSEQPNEDEGKGKETPTFRIRRVYFEDESEKRSTHKRARQDDGDDFTFEFDHHKLDAFIVDDQPQQAIDPVIYTEQQRDSQRESFAQIVC